MTVQVVPIQPTDLERVARYLHAHHRSRFTVEEWASSGIAAPWPTDVPNRGFMLVDGDEIGGVLIAMYSNRRVDGEEIRICNLSSWNVRPEYRFHSMRLLRAALSQEGFYFTDLTPTEEVQKINLRLGFEYLDTVTALVPNLPMPSRPGGVEITVSPEELSRRLAGPSLQIYRDHAHAIPARHVLLTRGDDTCYVMFRRERRRKMPVFASLLYVSDPEAFKRMAPPFLRHLLLRHGVLATLIDTHIVDYHPPWSVMLGRHRPKMVKTGDTPPERIHALYLYSDLSGIPT